MKVTGVDVVGRRIPLADDFPVSYEDHDRTEHVFVRLRTDTDLVGYGEGTALPWFTGETTASMAAFVEEWLAPRVVDADLEAASAGLESFGTAFPGNPGGQSAVELALLDLRAKRAGVPVRELLGPTVRDRIPLVYPVPGVDPDRAVELVETGLAAGFRRFKLKATGEATADLDRIEAVLDRLPADATVRVDPNTSWEHFPGAARIVRRIGATEKIEYLEQPVAADRPADLRRLWEETGVPVFADESVHGPDDVERLGADSLAAGCHLKLAKTGSLRTLAHMAWLANHHDLAVTVVSAFGTSLESTALLHLAATCRTLSSACELDPGLIGEDPVTEPLDVQPSVAVPDAPGLGVEPDVSML